MEKDVRWLQRLQNFERAVKLLQEIAHLEPSQLSLLEKVGIGFGKRSKIEWSQTELYWVKYLLKWVRKTYEVLT